MNDTQYSPEMFKPHIGESFDVKLPDHSVALLLKEVEPLPANESMLQFSIVFHGPRNEFLRQQIYDLAHPALGTLSLFLVPVGEEANAYLYQAVFSRMIASKNA